MKQILISLVMLMSIGCTEPREKVIDTIDDQLVEKVFFKNGNLKHTCYLDQDSIRNGMYIEYYESGVVKIECYYKDG